MKRTPIKKLWNNKKTIKLSIKKRMVDATHLKIFLRVFRSQIRCAAWKIQQKRGWQAVLFHRNWNNRANVLRWPRIKRIIKRHTWLELKGGKTHILGPFFLWIVLWRDHYLTPKDTSTYILCTKKIIDFENEN